MGAGLVAAGSDGLRDSQGQALGAASDVESAGRLLASALGNVRQSAVKVGGDKAGAVDSSGLHGTGLDDVEEVPRRKVVSRVVGKLLTAT